MINFRRTAATSGLALADLTALISLAPDPKAVTHDLAAPHAWLAAVSADEAAGTLARTGLWVAAVWLGLGLLAATAIHLPGGLGRIARSVSRALLPAAVYRLVAGAVGLGVLLAPVAAGARGVSAPHAGAGPASAASSALPAPTWPSNPPRSTPRLPAPAVPTAHPERADVVVRAGDSLWHIAAQQLGSRASSAEIAATWPRWYAANRPVIGADPDLIMPGDHLHAPVPMQAKR